MLLSSVLRTSLSRSLKPHRLTSETHKLTHKLTSGFGSLQSTKPYHMSMVPYIVRELIRDLDRPTLYDQNFGLGLSAHDMFDHGIMATPLMSGYMRPWRALNQMDSGVSNIINDKDSFKVNLDVQQFKPEELKVKVVDNCVVIEGKHEERSDEHGFVSRQFTRRYQLPDNVDMQALQSSLSSDGVLQLCAPKKSIEDKGARSIPITHTNAPAVKAADNKQQLQGKDAPKAK